MAKKGFLTQKWWKSLLKVWKSVELHSVLSFSPQNQAEIAGFSPLSTEFSTGFSKGVIFNSSPQPFLIRRCGIYK